MIETTLAEREKTHGRYRESAALAQTLKQVVRAHAVRSAVAPYQLEAIDMILFKIARIISGNPAHADHWHDVAGYATLVLKELEKNAT